MLSKCICFHWFLANVCSFCTSSLTIWFIPKFYLKKKKSSSTKHCLWVPSLLLVTLSWNKVSWETTHGSLIILMGFMLLSYCKFWKHPIGYEPLCYHRTLIFICVIVSTSSGFSALVYCLSLRIGIFFTIHNFFLLVYLAWLFKFLAITLLKISL